jgi:hypothetical protein
LPVDHTSRDADGPSPSLHGHCPASSLLRDSPPLPGESVLSASRVRRLCLFPLHRRTGSQVPDQSPGWSHATSTPDTAWPVIRCPPRFSRRERALRFWCHLKIVSRPPQWFACARLSNPHMTRCPRAFSRDVHHPRHWTAAAHGCLKPAPASRLRRVLLHLWYSIALHERVLDTTSPKSSNFLNAPFFWPGLIQADIAWPVILCRLGWTLCEWSGRRDSNPRSLGPEPSAIPGFATSRRLEFSARCTVHSVPRSRTESQFAELRQNCEDFTPSITPA